MNADNVVPFRPQTAEQINAPHLGRIELPPEEASSDAIRHKMLEQFDHFKQHLEGYRDYAQRISALSLEYHAAKFQETWPDVPVEELTLAASLDARETPKSLDTKLAQLASATPVKRIIFDRLKSTYHLFV